MLIRDGVGDRLREERDRLGKNQTDFGELVGVSRGTQKAYELGSSSPDVRYLAALENCGVDVLYVLTGEHFSVSPASLTENEAAVLANFMALSEEDQAAVLRVTKALVASSGAKAVKKNG